MARLVKYVRNCRSNHLEIDNHLRKSLCSIWYQQQQEQQEHDNTSRFLSIIRKYDAIEGLDSAR
jgi:hypothetical protein